MRPAQGVLRYYIMGILWRISLFRASGYSCTLSLLCCFPPHSSYFRIHALPCMCGAPTRTITTEREGWVGAGRRSLPLHRCRRGRLRSSPIKGSGLGPSVSVAAASLTEGTLVRMGGLDPSVFSVSSLLFIIGNCGHRRCRCPRQH